MDFIDKKMFEVTQTNNELNKEDIIDNEEGNINQKNGIILEKVSGTYFTLKNFLFYLFVICYL